MSRRLGIVVPYRDRQAHLDEFIPHMLRFFEREGPNRVFEWRILIVEQSPDLPFNRGAVKNIGFATLAPDIDCVCFHDVDWLPVDADYGWPVNPAMLISDGLPFPPEFVRNLFGGAVLLQNSHFVAANGYSNDYWRWGFEDVDLRERLVHCGLQPEHRQGTYVNLPHIDEGSRLDGAPTEAHVENQALYVDRWLVAEGEGWRRRVNTTNRWRGEGLSSTRFEVI